MRGLRIGVTGARRAQQLADAFERRGAVPVVGPLVTTDVPVDDARVVADTDRVVEARPDWLAASTGVGMRLWSEAARRHGRLDVLRDTLAGCRRVARGAKAVGGLAAFDLAAHHTTGEETDAAVVAWIADRLEPGQSVVAQLHGTDTSAYDELTELGAGVLTVRTYVAGRLPEDEARARALVQRIADGTLDLVAFTSPGAVHNLFALATELGDDVARGVDRHLGRRVAVAVIGAVTAAPLVERGVPIAVIPHRHRQGELVREIDRWAGSTTA